MRLHCLPLLLSAVAIAFLTSCQTVPQEQPTLPVEDDTMVFQAEVSLPESMLQEEEENQESTIEEEFVPTPETLSFLPFSTVSEPKRGDNTIPFDEVDPTVKEKLREVKFKPRVFPFHDTGGGLAFSSHVGVPKLEVQDLRDGRIRVFVRFQNIVDKDLRLFVTCEPTQGYNTFQERRQQLGVLLAQDVFRDFSFIINGPPDRKFVITCEAKIIKPSR